MFTTDPSMIPDFNQSQKFLKLWKIRSSGLFAKCTEHLLISPYRLQCYLWLILIKGSYLLEQINCFLVHIQNSYIGAFIVFHYAASNTNHSKPATLSSLKFRRLSVNNIPRDARRESGRLSRSKKRISGRI